MADLRKIKAGLVKYEITEFVGEVGNIFFNVETGELRLSDGVTPGGLPICCTSSDTPSARTVAFTNTAQIEVSQTALTSTVEVWIENEDASATNFNASLFNGVIFNQVNKYILRRTNDYDVEIIPSDALMTITLPEAKTGLIRIQ